MDNNLCTIYVVRHGETEWNVAKKIQGHLDSSLTENGLIQAKELGKQLQTIHFDAVFSSDLLRAKRTAEIITLEKKLALETTELLRERAFGKYEGEQIEKLRKMEETLDQLSDEEKYSLKMHSEIESDEEIMQRLLTFIREIAVRYAGKTVLIVTHGGILRTLLIHIGFATYKTLPWGKIKNTAYVKIDTDGVDFFVKETQGITSTSQ